MRQTNVVQGKTESIDEYFARNFGGALLEPDQLQYGLQRPSSLTGYVGILFTVLTV